jgi:hypothetical protein
MNFRTHQKAWWILEPLLAMDPNNMEGKDGGRDTKGRTC